ncbi:uncharacterized protein STEHIDRAFT_182854 [Stereum hirsutum FP-91666 SS1]|uniref:uncharacterized protein n=1 Tax=Stereum hirsutum (strain FP-91666) TaxID=721885 RepID=UPI000440CCA8|nr:uncharacterized protein STEHIDRAFT_182854 [Stereum hirsutum FP-91666 SS1]EIM91689.1 hypothetical protein STEHIDRAFT_182854 [Stereum hirsutum FP-91666 SS1]
MFKSLTISLVALAMSAPALSVSIYGQCGGVGWTGDTTCDAGLVCTHLNDYYYQCLAGTSATTTPITSPSTTSSAPAPTGSTNPLCSNATTKFQYFGVNESGAEFGNTVIPGALGTDYIWPAPSSIDYFMNLGFNTFRVPFLMERMVPPSTGMTGAFNQTYFSGLSSTVSYITGKGGFVLIEPHNYMIYNGATITSTSDFQTFWTNLATEFKTNDNVIFDLMNEPHDIPATTVFDLMAAGIKGVRAAGATTQLIMVEGTSWTGAWTWTSSGNAAAFTGINAADPNNNVAIEMHQYLDSDGSGTSDVCVSSDIGASRLADATSWLIANNIKGFLGEMGAGSNDVCIEAVQGALCTLQEAGGVWLGALWWAAGQWWGDYYQSIEPPSGPAIPSILPQALEPFL